MFNLDLDLVKLYKAESNYQELYVGVKVRDVVESILEMCVGLAQLQPHQGPHFRKMP
jgi:hypothetical protein